MKIFYTTLLFLAVLTTGLSQTAKMNYKEILNDEEIKKVYIRYFKSEDTLKTEGRDLIIKEFDQFGKITRNYIYTFWDVVSYDHNTTYQYDDEGRLVEKTKIQTILNLGKRDEEHIKIFGDEPINERTIYRYNEKGLLNREETYSFGRDYEKTKLSSSIEYYYNDKNQIYKEIGATPNGRVIYQNYTAQYEYDEEGRKIKEVRTFTQTGSVRFKTFKYNNSGQLIEEKTNEEGNRLQTKHLKYEYDSFGNKTKELKFDERTNSFEVFRSYEFDENGQRIFGDEQTSFEYYSNGLIKQELWKSNRSDQIVNFITSYEFYE